MSSGGRRRPPNTDGMVSLKVDNLTFRTTPEELKRVFEKYGDVGDVYIPRDPYTQESRGFAFVRFFDQRDADDAIDRIDGMVLDGREIRVKMAKHPRPMQSYYRGGDSGASSSRSRHRQRSYSRSRSRSRSRRHSSTQSRSRSRSKNGRNRNNSEEKWTRSDKDKSNSRDNQSRNRERTRSPEGRGSDRSRGRGHSRRSDSRE